MTRKPRPDMPAHTAGTPRGEEYVRKHGREPGRRNLLGRLFGPHLFRGERTARDATSISPLKHGPIDPRMPHLPPA